MDLSVIIPARNEDFLQHTIDDVLAHTKADTEIIVILDGYWPEAPIPDHDRVILIHHSKSIGQRAAVNEAARLSRAKYIMKLDAHCSVDDGFDLKLIEDCEPNWTVIPQMYNLHAFDWRCVNCGERTYQGPPLVECKKCHARLSFEKMLVWKRRLKKLTQFWYFDKKLKFQYWYDYKKRAAAAPAIADTMSSIGACFFMARDRFFDLEGLDEAHGGWGQMGTEIACKSWLSGGRHVVSKNTWFAHMFRTNNKGFSFPYPISGRDVSAARKYSRNLWLKDAWPKAIHKLSWLVDKFAPVPDWHEPVEPVKPVEPVEPVKSVEPVEPVEPDRVGPNRQTGKPAKPVESVEPVEPDRVGPNRQTGKPAKPVKSVESVEPVEPVEPDRVGPNRQTGKPAKPPLLSVLIPARNEKFLQATIDDIYKNFTTDFEIIVGLDDYDPDPPLVDDDRLTIYRAERRLGMRPMINKLAAMARGKFIMKVDAHCSFDTGYDQKLIDHCTNGVTILGVRYELDTERWQRRDRTNCDFRYLSNPFTDDKGGLRGLAWPEYAEAHQNETISESMSLSGSAYLMQKAQWDFFGGLDENHGTMYQEGAEVACMTWLSGGRLLINRDTWYAHHNRGKAPYALSTKQRQKSINYSIELWRGNRWPKQKYSFDWLLDKFSPPYWPAVAKDTRAAPRQGTLLKGISELSVEELWAQRLAVSEPLKRFRLEIFFNAFKEFLQSAKVTPDCAYYHYLMSHRSKSVIYKPATHQRRRTLLKMQGGLDLYKDIQKNGLLAPLEFYAKDGNLILFRGYRRLVVLHLLGIETVAGRVHRTELTAKKVTDAYTIVPGSINALGAAQFAEHAGRATDKYYVHNYLDTYDRVIGHLRARKIKILEFGILRGASVLLWQTAFPRAEIIGVDKNVTTWKRFAPEDLDRVKILVGKQEDATFLKSKVMARGPFNVIMDDCGHDPAGQLACFHTMWPALAPSGFYIIEDCYRSFLPGHNGANVPRTLADGVNRLYEDYGFKSIQLYNNLCIVQKGI